MIQAELHMTTDRMFSEHSPPVYHVMNISNDMTYSHLTPHTSHLTPHTSHITPHTSHLTPHTFLKVGWSSDQRLYRLFG